MRHHSTAARRLQNADGDEVASFEITNGVLSNDQEKPTFSNVTVASGKLELTFSENIAAARTLNKEDFSITGYDIEDVTISSGKLLISRKLSLSSQVFYEDFEDQSFTGSVTNVSTVSGGYEGSNYALQGDGTQANKVWWQSTSDSLTDIKAISFWHYAVEEDGVIYLYMG